MKGLRFGAVMAAAVGALLAFSATAVAEDATSSVNDDGALVVSFGFGNPDVIYSLGADATARYACINGGGKNPSAAASKQASEGQVSGEGVADRNGVASITAGPLLAPQFSCPKGQRRVLAAVTYTNVVVTQENNNVSFTAPDASRVFVNV